MKTSNQLLLGLLAVLLTATIGIDFILKNKYGRISLSDPYKNYEVVAVHPFKYLKIKGGNAYGVEIKQAARYDLKVMVSRKSFLNTRQHGDTLLIGFSVMSSPANRDPESLPRGLIISAPFLSVITADGTNTIIHNFKTDSLMLNLSGNAIATINHLQTMKLLADCRQNASVDFHSENVVNTLALQLSGNASALLQDITYTHFNPLLTGNSRLILTARSAQKLNQYEKDK